MSDFLVNTGRGAYLIRDHGPDGFAVVPPYSPGPPDFWADTVAEAKAWAMRDGTA